MEEHSRPPHPPPPPPVHAEKLIEEFPTIIGTGDSQANTSDDLSRYELDSQFSIYKIDSGKQTNAAGKKQSSVLFDINDPNDFLIESDSSHSNYVDLDFDFNFPTKSQTASVNDKESDISQKLVNDHVDDSLLESLNQDDLFDEKCDLIDMSASIISQTDNSSFSENIDFQTHFATENVDSDLAKKKSDDSTLNSVDDIESVNLITPTSTSNDQSSLNLDLRSQADVLKNNSHDGTLGNSSDSSANVTQVEASPITQVQLDSFSLESTNKNEVSQQVNSLTNILLQSLPEKPTAPSFEDHKLDNILNYEIGTFTSVPTIPEEEFVEELSTSFSTFTPTIETTKPEILLAEQVSLPDSSSGSTSDENHESENRKTFVSKGESKEQSFDLAIEKPLASASIEVLHTSIAPSKMNFKAEISEEFVMEPSKTPHFVDDSHVRPKRSTDCKSEDLFESPHATELSSQSNEAFPIELSAFALPQQPVAITSSNESREQAFISDVDLIEQKVDSLFANSNNELSLSNAIQVCGDDAVGDQPVTDGHPKKDLSVSESVAATQVISTSSTLIAETSSPPSIVSKAAAVTPQDSSPPSPSQQQQHQKYNQPQQQSEHIDTIEPSSTDLLHTSSPAISNQLLSALREETEEEEVPTKVSLSQNQEPKATTPQTKGLSNSPEQKFLSHSSNKTSLSAPSSSTPSSASVKMARNKFKRESSNDTEDSGPDQVKEYIQTLLGPNAVELVYWRDPKNTGIVFGIGLVILLSLSIFSVISVVAYTLLFTLLGTLSFRVYKNVLQALNKSGEGHPFKEYLDIEFNPSEERINDIVKQLVSQGTSFIKRLRSVLLVEDIVDSLKYLLVFWALTYIGAWFNGLTLVILAYISSFSLPKVYDLNKTQIDQYIELINRKITELTEKVPFLKKPAPVEKKDD